jgi:hypothetical protein
VTPPRPDGPVRGIVRLLNTADGPLLCLAGAVDGAAVDSFRRRYGREPARVSRIDTGSATSLSAPALELVLDHVEAAWRAGRPLGLDRAPQVGWLLDDAGTPLPGGH